VKAVFRVARADAGFWGGQLAHVGIAVVALTIAASGGLAEQETLTIPVGQSLLFAGYALEFEEPFTRSEPNRDVVGGRIGVSRSGDTVGSLEPRFHVYPNRVDPVVTPSIRVTFLGDLYLTPVAVSEDQIRITAFYHPGISYLWAGGFLVALGGAWALLMGRSRARRRDDALSHS
ncbi:MAG: cytochrome c-type biogenesis CcmF C-terminal domain-containing protein, partial [Acidimicrobiia bacterium]